MKLPVVSSGNVKNKRIFLRGDLDVPIGSGKVLDDTRLLSVLPTLKLLFKEANNIFLAGHLGRPKRHESELSLRPVAEWFAKELSLNVSQKSLDDFPAFFLSEKLFILENLRFFKEEEENSKEFAKKLAHLGEVYINEAFSVSHRAHASVVGVPLILPHFAGLHLEKEIKNLLKILENPERPLTVIIGGEKIETKLPLVESMLDRADFVLVGGQIAGHLKLPMMLEHEKKVRSTNSGQARASALFVADLEEGEQDITGKSVSKFKEIIKGSKTVVWNGPLGFIGKEETERGTFEIASQIASVQAFSIVGGGDTLEFLKRKNLLNKFSFYSTGGGAMLEFLSGRKLPGLEVLL